MRIRRAVARPVWTGGLVAVAVLLAASVLPGCSRQAKVARVEADTTIDLSGRWNDTDSRLVAEEMIADCLGRPWITQHRRYA